MDCTNEWSMSVGAKLLAKQKEKGIQFIEFRRSNIIC